MKSTLASRLVDIVSMFPEDERERLLATLRVGAAMALIRIREHGGTYADTSDIGAVESELFEDAADTPSIVADDIPVSLPESSL